MLSINGRLLYVWNLLLFNYFKSLIKNVIKLVNNLTYTDNITKFKLFNYFTLF